MAKPDLGTKRVCPDTGRKFYDLNRTPVISPYTGKVVPIAAASPPRARTETASAAKASPAADLDSIAPETAEAEFVSLEDAEAEQQGKKTLAPEEAAVGEDEEVEMDESLDDAAFIEEEEEGNPDVTDIIGESIEKEEES
ncbi:MAG TPA: TIGR02300 family protein [Pseudolabrys sp.]|nr:TIGR02300 family protein [Pseudolabrys sp.]